MNHTPAQGTGKRAEVEPAGYNSRTGERWRWAKKQYHDPEDGHEWSEIADEMRQLSAKLEGELTALTAALSSHAELRQLATAVLDAYENGGGFALVTAINDLSAAIRP